MEGSMDNALTVANRFIELAKEDGQKLTPMQVLKLVYIAHGWALGLYGEPLIYDEVQAWQYGPVIPRLYNAIRQFRNQPIDKPLSTPQEELTPRERDVIKQVYKIYGHMSGPQLSRLTHAADSPWERIYRHGKFGVVIPNDTIKKHYAKLAKARQATA